jgi:hypothetical protein
MATLGIQQNTAGTGIIERGPYKDGLLTSAGATTYLKNTLLALDSSTLKFVPFVKGGVTNDNGTPRYMITEETVVAGAGDTAIRAMITGEIALERTVIHADGDSSNIDEAVRAACEQNGLVLLNRADLSKADNS